MVHPEPPTFHLVFTLKHPRTIFIAQLPLRLEILKACKPRQRERNAERQLECHIVLQCRL